jgi:hypothetical protein
MKKWLFLLVVCISPNVFALTALNSSRGADMLASSLQAHYADSFLSEVRYFTSQQNTTFCGIASAIIILNTLNITPPKDEAFGEYRLFTQDNLFTTDGIKKSKIKKDAVLTEGLTLSQETQLLNSFPNVKATMYSSRKLSLEKTKAILLKVLKSNKQLILANILRSHMDEKGGGHFSPVVAYDPKSDSVLFMDVAVYKYGPTWVPIKTLYSGMYTKDGNSYRGFIVISNTSPL